VDADAVRVGATVVWLRYGSEDAATARRVEAALPAAVAAAERWGALARPLVITIHPNHGALEEATHRGGQAWLRGWARFAAVDLQSPRTWSTGMATDEQLLQLLTHELTHCVMYQRVATEATWHDLAIPLWFKEGMASVTAGQRHRRARADTVRQLYAARATGGAAAAEPELLGDGVQALDAELAYAVAHLAFRFLVERHGDDRVHRLMTELRAGRGFDSAFQLAIGIPVREFERAFRAHHANG
jgi:hypothetical protein